MQTIQFITEHGTVIVAALLAVSEVLALIPAVKSNSVFEVIVGVLQKLIPAEKK